MRRWMLLLLVGATWALGFAPAPPPRPDKGKDDLKQMEGTWVLVSVTDRGEPLAQPGAWRLVIVGDRMRYRRGEMTSEDVLTLDALKKPKAYVSKAVRGVTTASVVRGIYSVEGDTLKFCNNGPGAGAPEAFEGPKAGTFLYVYKREP